MTGLPALVVSVPARNVAEARVDISTAAAAGADLVEIRFDRWSETARASAGQLFPAPVPLVATFRSTDEGGEGPTDPLPRRQWVERVARLPFAYVDLELARDVVDGSPVEGDRAIGSCHFPDGTPVDAVAAFLARAPASCRFVKAVVPLTVGQFVRDLLPRYAGWTGDGRVVTTTGPSGPLSRLWARELGQPLVFASLPIKGGGTPVEPSQVPVDQLRRMWASDRPRQFAVVGHPVGHSLSPRIHAGWLAAEGRGAAFVALDLSDEGEFAEMVNLGRSGRWAGWSVTHPWKEAAARAADHASEVVRRTGAANTLTFRDGELRADLTDAAAVRRRADELHETGRWDGREALIVGTGGAARAAAFALRSGTTEVLLLGRRADRVAAVSRDAGGRPVDPADARPVGLVVHATTVGREGQGPLSPSLAGWLNSTTTLLDFVYSAVDLEVSRACERVGARYEDGRRLLVYQAADAHRLWWGEPPRSETFAEALQRVGCEA